jgi:hypothetical protein
MYECVFVLSDFSFSHACTLVCMVELASPYINAAPTNKAHDLHLNKQTYKKGCNYLLCQAKGVCNRALQFAQGGTGHVLTWDLAAFHIHSAKGWKQLLHQSKWNDIVWLEAFSTRMQFSLGGHDECSMGPATKENVFRIQNNFVTRKTNSPKKAF